MGTTRLVVVPCEQCDTCDDFRRNCHEQHYPASHDRIIICHRYSRDFRQDVLRSYTTSNVSISSLVLVVSGARFLNTYSRLRDCELINAAS
jgi:hypothetical protein